MGKRDPKTASGSNSSSSKGKHLHEAHKTTAATTAKVAAAQEEAKQTTPDTTNSPRVVLKDTNTTSHKSSNQKESRKKLLQKQTTVNSDMAPGISSTVNAIQRIAENGAPPLKLSSSPAAKVSRLKPSKPSSKSSLIKSPVISTSSPPTIGRLHPHPETPLSEGRPPPLPARPSPQRSTSAEGSLLSMVKKGRGQIRSGGLGAAKFLGKKGHEAWGKIKKGKSGSSAPAGSTYGTRDTSNDIDVFGMDLRDAVHKTRIIKQRGGPGEAAYWMPALAYRCLQYLNVHGPQELGIYRISGSTSVVDELRAGFKIHHDVDLFDHPPDDLHTVSSLLKGWFRSLPEAVLPLDVQKRVYERCKDQTDSVKPPPAFVEELSNLPPYNYYLLCHLFYHLSTVCSASDVNKMNIANLGMIFCSTLRIDRFCFNWLVNSWGDCWTGCSTEEEEYKKMTLLKRQPSTASSSAQSQYHDASSAPESRSTSRTGTGVDRWPSNSSINQKQRTQTPSPEPRSLTRSLSRVARRKGSSKDKESKESKEAKERKKKDRSNKPSPPLPQWRSPNNSSKNGNYRDSDQSSLQVEIGRPPKSPQSDISSRAGGADPPKPSPSLGNSADRLPGTQPASPMMGPGGAML